MGTAVGASCIGGKPGAKMGVSGGGTVVALISGISGMVGMFPSCRSARLYDPDSFIGLLVAVKRAEHAGQSNRSQGKQRSI